MLQLPQPSQVALAPQPHGPAIAYAQLGGLNLGPNNPAVQGHNGYAYGAGRLLRITRLYHYGIYIPYLDAQVKLFVGTYCGQYAGGWRAAAYGWFAAVSVMP